MILNPLDSNSDTFSRTKKCSFYYTWTYIARITSLTFATLTVCLHLLTNYRFARIKILALSYHSVDKRLVVVDIVLGRKVSVVIKSDTCKKVVLLFVAENVHDAIFHLYLQFVFFAHDNLSFGVPFPAFHKEKYPCYEQCANLKVYSKDMEIYVKIE